MFHRALLLVTLLGATSGHASGTGHAVVPNATLMVCEDSVKARLRDIGSAEALHFQKYGDYTADLEKLTAEFAPDVTASEAAPQAACVFRYEVSVGSSGRDFTAYAWGQGWAGRIDFKMESGGYFPGEIRLVTSVDERQEHHPAS